MNRFNIGDDAYVFCGMQIVKFKIAGINVCKETGVINIDGRTTADEPIIAPQSVCRNSPEDLVDEFNERPGQFFITLRPVITFEEVV